MACPNCDTLHRRTDVPPREAARCVRCHSVLYRAPDLRLSRVLALTLTCLIVFAIANAFPIVEIEVQGIYTRTTLIGAAWALYREGMWLVALLVFTTTVLSPLSQLLALVHLIGPLSVGRRPYAVFHVLRAIEFCRPWGMIEVFMLGVLVSVVKLSSMASVLPGIALWAFGALTVLLAMVLSYDLRNLWLVIDHTPNADAPDASPSRRVPR
ncbi:paraquat-inducible protein A [Pandoraea sp. XJJ-1]|uniref:paraquat-inducible protein A n=1 Tax=unclassified Pandoraea TaxID=2624094 RepID=UPI00037045F6|nr:MULTISPECIES: paraquat-inducible protein A [unclassified Pandoraea]WAL84227.1 paraquat-inducible protein A [Pandoraea sp. XJJ-1]